MTQLFVDTITAILTIDTNIVTKYQEYQGMNKDIEHKKKSWARVNGCEMDGTHVHTTTWT